MPDTTPSASTGIPAAPPRSAQAPPAGPAPGRGAGPRLALLLAAVLAILLGAAVAQSWRDHADALEEGWRGAERGALGVAEHGAAALSAAMTVTDRIEDALRRDGPGRFTGPGWPDLAAFARYVPQISSLWLTDAGGRVIANTLRPEPAELDLSTRPYFAPLRDGLAETYLMPLAWGIASRVWFFSINRAVQDAEGRFAGVVQAAMHAGEFLRYYQGLDLGPHARAGLYRTADGAPLMMWPLPPAPADGGFVLAAAPRGAAVLREEVARTGASAGRFVLDAGTSSTGEALLVAWRRVGPGGEMVAAVAIPRAQALAPFRARLLGKLFLLLPAAVVLAGLGTAVAAAQRRGARARLAAEAGQRDLAAVLEATSDGVLALDPDWRITYLNRHGAAWIADGADLHGRSLWDCFPEAVGGPFWQAYQRSMHQRLPATVESAYAPLGRVFHAESHPRGDGGIVVFFRDVTEARAAAAALAASEAEFRATFEQAAVGFAHVAPDGRFLRVNGRLCTITGRTREELLATDFQQITHPDDLGADLGLMQALLAGEIATYAMEKRYLRPGGETVWVNLTASAVRDAEGRPERFISVVEDISARKAAERRLAESEQRFRTLMDGAPVMIWVTDAAGRCTYLNRRWYEMTGQSQEEALGFGWLGAIHPEDHAAAEAGFLVALAAHGPSRLEYRLRRADGTWLWVIDAGEPRFAADGGFLGHVGAVFDIGDRKEAEERQTLLAREVDHRARNALAVVQSILGLTRAEDIAGFRAAVTGRVAAMARAHTLLAREKWDGAGLGEIVGQELEAYSGGDAPRVATDGAPVSLAPGAAQPLAMALHELATNAAKYGALSRPGGHVDVAWSRTPPAEEGGTEGGLLLRWRERGGPRVEGPPERRGFGSSVMTGTVERQLQGRVDFAWEPEGLTCEIWLPPSQLRWR